MRGYFDDTLVFDTTGARYVWEAPYYPQYYIPISDVRMEHLLDEDHPQRLQLGSSRLYSLTSGGRTHRSAARVSTTPKAAAQSQATCDSNGTRWIGSRRIEQIIAHPRNPYVRVDVLRSHRHIEVEIEGVVLAETHSPVLLFETGLPTRYLSTAPRSRLNISKKATPPSPYAPTKGTTSRYWSAHIGDALHPDIAWSYEYPASQVAQIAGLVAFYNERLDIFVDGQELPRPSTHFA